MGEQTQITNVLWQSINPDWGESLFFREICAASELVVEVLPAAPSLVPSRNFHADHEIAGWLMLMSYAALGRACALKIPQGSTCQILGLEFFWRWIQVSMSA